MTNTEIFEEIFWQVGEEAGLNSWWEIFDSEVFCEVEDRIAERFGVADASEVPEFNEWNDEMADEL